MFFSLHLGILYKISLVVMLYYNELISKHPVRVCIFEAAYVRALDRQNITHGALFIPSAMLQRLGALTSFSYSCTFVIHFPFILHAILAYVYAILFLLYVIGDLRASLRRLVENGVGGAAVEIVHRSDVTFFRYGEQFPVLWKFKKADLLNTRKVGSSNSTNFLKANRE